MKNKKDIYILLGVVLLIWGGVAYQFFSLLDADDHKVQASVPFDIKPLKLKPRDTLSIDVNYRDPFLGKMYAPLRPNALKRKYNKKHVVPATTHWPAIIFKGIVSDTKDQKKVFMVIIDGNAFLMRKGSIEKEVLLKNGDRQSIEVKYKGESNKIMLQN